MPARFQFNSDLLDDLARRQVVLFVGAGASKAALPRAGGRFKDWAEFLTDAAKELGRDKKKKVLERIEKKDYLIASELLKSFLQDRWVQILSAEFQQAADTPELHRTLIGLNQRIIVTTNFDKLLESAWSESQPSRFPNVISSVDHKIFRLFRNDDPYLIKLHGTIDAPESIVFDKTSYQREAYANQFYKDLIGTLLLTHTFLFIGFSMDDPAISSIVEFHAHRYSDSRPHYIFVPGAADPAIDELSKSLRKLFVIRYSSDNNHAQLVEAIAQLSKAAAERRRLIAVPKITPQV